MSSIGFGKMKEKRFRDEKVFEKQAYGIQYIIGSKRKFFSCVRRKFWCLRTEVRAESYKWKSEISKKIRIDLQNKKIINITYFHKNMANNND